MLPYFRVFQQSRGVNVDEDGAHEYPQCYKSIDAECCETLIMQDLSENGFIMINQRAKPVSFDHIKLVMQTIGKFHAVSIAMKNLEPEKFEQITSNITEIFFRSKSPVFALYVNCVTKLLVDAITDEKDVHLLQHISRMWERDLYELGKDLTNGKYAEPYAVLSHGENFKNIYEI